MCNIIQKNQLRTPYIMVTRHPGAIEWLNHKIGRPAARVIPHLDPEQWEAQLSLDGHRISVIVGVLPVHWLLRLGRLGIECWVIDAPLPLAARQAEMTAGDLWALPARLVQVRIAEI